MDFIDMESSDYDEHESYDNEEVLKRIFDGLNPRQVEAVKCLQGPLLVMAGAGSGKTKVLTCRIANLLAHGVSPWQILAITFTNKAANEMKTRAEKMIGEAAKSVWLSTFHSFCAKILRIEIDSVEGYNKNFLIYSTGDTKVVIRDCINELNLDDKTFIPNLVLSRISAAKNHLLNAEEYKEKVYFSNIKSEFEIQVANLYGLYEKRLKELNAMDFDDLLMVTVRLFETKDDVLERYQEKFKYVLIDEYQDTNVAQYKIMKLIADKYKNVCVVGDADQSIYGWRGANIGNILNFEMEYPNATVIKLEQNYRSTKVILDAANAVIEHNIYRKPKVLWTENSEGEPITMFEALTSYYEAQKIAVEINNLIKSGFQYKDIALLYRINAQSRALEEAFVRAGIPYVIIGGLKFYDRVEIKNILAYLRLVYNIQDTMSLTRIINVPKRGIGTATLVKLQDFAESHDISVFEVISNTWLLNQVGLSARLKSNIQEFATFILKCIELKNTMSIDKLIKYILDNSGYMNELKTDQRPETESRIENLGEFINVAKEFVTQNPSEATLESFLNQISLISDLDVVNENENLVSLMTVHSAKGLEFPIVFLTGMEEGVFPHAKSLMDEKQIEEERRACYVAITRAQKKLFITLASSRPVFGEMKTNYSSRFLEEIPKKYLDIYKQDRSSKKSMPEFIHVQPSRVASAIKISRPAKNVLFETADNLNKESKLRSRNKQREQIEINLAKRWRQGDKIKHKKWGEGIVLDVIGMGLEKELKVRFLDNEIGIKKLTLQFAPIVKVKD